MGKKIFYIILLLLIVYGIWSFVNITGAKIRYGSIRDQVRAIVKFTPSDSDTKIRKKIKFKAEDVKLVITDEEIEISRHNSDISINVSYTDSAVLPFGLKTLYYEQEIEISKEDIEK